MILPLSVGDLDYPNTTACFGLTVQRYYQGQLVSSTVYRGIKKITFNTSNNKKQLNQHEILIFKGLRFGALSASIA